CDEKIVDAHRTENRPYDDGRAGEQERAADPRQPACDLGKGPVVFQASIVSGTAGNRRACSCERGSMRPVVPAIGQALFAAARVDTRRCAVSTARLPATNA